MKSKVGNLFVVNSGSYFAGEVGCCIEQLSEEVKFKKSKYDDYVKLELEHSGTVTWFNLNELTEVVL
ncbi:hypothetical protein FKOIJHOC_00117 [Acinetobacter phage Ab_121]|nr:hypothetical protein FKOIJHOC_00117 [Acinetobacter phage Ab_121]